MKRRAIAVAATAGVIGLLLLGLLWIVARDAPQEPAAPADEAWTPTTISEPVAIGLPDEADFVQVGESASFKLWADPVTGHFKAESKAGGRIWRSYPDPEHWEAETAAGIWRSNFLSPVMLEYIDASSSNSQTKMTNWMEEKGVMENYEKLDNGFRVIFHLTSTSFRIPVEVRLVDDYVEVKVVDSGIREGKLSLLNLKVYPQFGAQPSSGTDGYMLLPDGSGALALFEENKIKDKSIYRETVYGPDISFYNENTNRNAVRMPIFGLKSGEQGFLGVMTEGEEYAKLFAAPAGALGQSNWIGPEWQYRIKFFQSTDRQGRNGFYTFSKERFQAASRSVRYYLLEGSASDYVGMASRYRQYLIDERGLSRLKPEQSHIPFYADLIGADLRQGALWDDYIVGTTTEQAKELLEALEDAGIGNITAIYHGWQKWGYSSYGGLLPVDRRIGGNQGMAALAEEARRSGGKLMLAANYSLNNSGRGGFWSLNDGLRNLAGTLQESALPARGKRVSIVSPLYSFREARSDLGTYRELGIDGILYTGGIGSALYTDFNSRNRASRTEVLSGQQSLLRDTAAAVGYAAVEDGNFYSLAAAGHLHRIADDYSYDIFVDEAVPFAQIALHGLVTYTSEWGNLRDEYETEFLRSAEYGAYPAFVFTAASSDAFKKAYSVRYYSMNYRDWLETAARQYRKLDEALGDVQDRFITGHRELAPGVKMTIYDNGRAVIVNYNEAVYREDGVEVPGGDFAVIERRYTDEHGT